MNSLSEHKLVVADDGSRAAILSLLAENDLPTSDLDDTKILFACINNGDVVGTGGLELFKDCGLLRSICVRTDMQKRGLGKFIVQELEKIAAHMGIHRLYLLTTTAKDFFTKEDYTTIDRKDVPLEVKNTTEFSSVCPSTATVMRKFLS
jgi:amino-acid N-acetyltransferase